METVIDFIFLGSQITANGDCSHEIKRCFLLGRKAMTNLDSILKSRDITLLNGPSCQNYGFSNSHVWCESWTVEKAERQRIDAFELWCWRRLLRVPWTVRRSNQSILKEINPEYSLEELMLKLKLQCFGHLMARAAAAAAKLLQSCPTLCDPIDGSPPGSPVPGILQARTLEWVAISFSNAWKWKVKMKSLTHVWWERLKTGEGDDRRREGWMAPWTQRTWVWTEATADGEGRGSLVSMGSQRVGHN